MKNNGKGKGSVNINLRNQASQGMKQGNKLPILKLEFIPHGVDLMRKLKQSGKTKSGKVSKLMNFM